MSYNWRRSYRQYVVGKATSGWRGLGALMSWGPEKLLIRCSKESHHPAEWAPGPPVEHLENEKDTTLLAIRVEVKILKFLFGLQLPLTRKPWITFLNPYSKVRGTNLFLKKSSCVYLLLCCYDYENTTRVELRVMATKGYSTHFRAAELVIHNQMQFGFIFRCKIIRVIINCIDYFIGN